MGRLTYHRGRRLKSKALAVGEADNPWLDDQTTAQYRAAMPLEPQRNVSLQRVTALSSRAATPPSAAALIASARTSTIQQRADGALERFWKEQSQTRRSQIMARAFDPSWVRALAALVGIAMCVVFGWIVVAGPELPSFTQKTKTLVPGFDTAASNNAPAADSINAPAAASNNAPARDSINAPAAASNNAPARDSINAPAAASHNAPAAARNNAPAADNINAPAAARNNAPARDNINAPACDSINAPAAASNNAPAALSYNAPAAASGKARVPPSNSGTAALSSSAPAVLSNSVPSDAASGRTRLEGGSAKAASKRAAAAARSSARMLVSPAVNAPSERHAEAAAAWSGSTPAVGAAGPRFRSERSAPASNPPQVTAGRPATLHITSRPGSQVFIDNKAVGPTPQLSISLQPGVHNVRLHNRQLNLLKILTLHVLPGETIDRVEQLEP